jgi:hypothetical protein
MMRRKRVVKSLGVLLAGSLTLLSLGGASSARVRPVLHRPMSGTIAPVQQITGTHHGELIGAGMTGLLALRFARRRNWRP